MDLFCVRIWASGRRTGLSTSDLQFHLLHLVWDFFTAGRIVNKDFLGILTPCADWLPCPCTGDVA